MDKRKKVVKVIKILLIIYGSLVLTLSVINIAIGILFAVYTFIVPIALLAEWWHYSD